MKKHILLSSTVAAILLSGCSSVPNPLNTTATDQDIYDEYAAECTFKDGKTPAPKWICGYPLDAYPISKVGYSEAGSELEATAIARVELVARMRSDIIGEQTVETQTVGRQERNRFSAKSTVIIDGHVINSRAILKQVDPSTQGLYVLVVADAEAYEQAMREAQQRQDGNAFADIEE